MRNVRPAQPPHDVWMEKQPEQRVICSKVVEQLTDVRCRQKLHLFVCVQTFTAHQRNRNDIQDESLICQEKVMIKPQWYVCLLLLWEQTSQPFPINNCDPRRQAGPSLTSLQLCLRRVLIDLEESFKNKINLPSLTPRVNPLSRIFMVLFPGSIVWHSQLGHAGACCCDHTPDVCGNVGRSMFYPPHSSASIC